jgi:hypothetical protein
MRTETVTDLKDLMRETTSVSLDALVCSMIEKTRAERERLKDEGWKELWSRRDMK